MSLGVAGDFFEDLVSACCRLPFPEFFGFGGI